MKCSIHENDEATGTCVYCGKFFCSECLVQINGKQYCKSDVTNIVNEAKAQRIMEQPVINISNNNVNTNTNTNNNTINTMVQSTKNKITALILCLLGILGLCGLHRFYVGKIGTGLIWFFTFGLFGIGQIIDFIYIILGEFRDSNGFKLT
jgi:TM2 domain-containing membrane protein YozV